MANTKTAATPPNTYFQSSQGKWTSNPAYQAAAAGQAQKDVAAFGGMANLGIANQNALGQYGASRNASLTNQSVAAANAYGQMQNSYLNTMGQLGHIGAALSAAGLGAGAQSGSASQSGAMGIGGGGYGGFSSSGPEGPISSGMTGGMGGFGGTFGGMSGSSAQRGASPGERTGMVDQGYGFLSSLMKNMNASGGMPQKLASSLSNEFSANRAGIMDNSVLRALNKNLYGGYNAMSGLYGKADYGFNTPSAGKAVGK